jgi:hypothetical protein
VATDAALAFKSLAFRGGVEAGLRGQKPHPAATNSLRS